MTVAKAAPAIAWSNPADIVPGTPLGDAQLNAAASFKGAPMPGSYSYNQPAGTVLNAGPAQTLSVTFTPSDTTNFSTATASAQINVVSSTATPTETPTGTTTPTATATPGVIATPGPYSPGLLVDNPVAYWRLGEPAGAGTAADSSGFGHAASANGGVTFGVAGALPHDPNTAASFDGSSGYLTAPSAGNLSFASQPFTLEAWINPSAASGQTIVAKGQGSDPSQFEYALLYNHVATGDGSVSLLLNGGYRNSSPGKAPGGAWTHVVVVFDGTYASFYFNGVLDKAVNTSGPYASNAGGSLWIGSLGPSIGGYFTGTLDELAIYGYALPSGRIQAHVNDTSYVSPLATAT